MIETALHIIGSLFALGVLLFAGWMILNRAFG